MQRVCMHCGKTRTQKLELSEDRDGYECIDAAGCEKRVRTQRALDSNITAVVRRKGVSQQFGAQAS